MTVNPGQPFRLIYSLYQHEYLGFLFESYVVQLNELNKLTFTHQNISAKNAVEFATQLTEDDYTLIKTMDSMQQEVILNHFSKKRMKPHEFFLKVYHKTDGDKDLQREINAYLEKRRTVIMPLLQNRHVFEMGSDGEPAWKSIEVLPEKATILFHFRKNVDNTHYFPTLKLHDEKLEFRDKESYIISEDPGWMMVDRRLFTFEKPINGSKIKPFLKKKFILIPQNVEETYYKKFVAPLVAQFDVYAKGFDIRTVRYDPVAVLSLSEIQQDSDTPLDLFDAKNAITSASSPKVLLELCYQYGDHKFKADHLQEVSVTVEKEEDSYVFNRIVRKLDSERNVIDFLTDTGLNLRNSRVTLPESEAFEWLSKNQRPLLEKGIQIRQPQNGGKRYFIGESNISIQIEEKIDWFDIKAIVTFGEYEIPFARIRKLILQGKSEVTLPNGEIGIIPASWTEAYKDLLVFADQEGEETQLKKHHVALVQSLKEKDAANVSMSKKLERLLDYTNIEEHPLPSGFKGTLRPYQQAGYNWMLFLNDFAFGGCLADDMGLGKTVQTLAMLQHESEKHTTEGMDRATSLLVMPTSLIYNWIKEAQRFTPKLRVLNYTGSNRVKKPSQFAKYDLIITSYGVTRVDTELLQTYFFNYIILDESQVIKNPDSIISKCVRTLRSRRKLILTGTPIENSTLDLWSQLSFVNPGLLGNKAYFQKHYLIPIEKKQDHDKTRKLNQMIKPFILRRDKTQVAKDLPEKTISVKYCDLSPSQKEYYEAEKNKYRNEIMNVIERDGLNKSHIVLLQGLTKLRQIANHPIMVDPDYTGDSGKLEDIIYMIHNALGKDHNILIFSQFVKHLKLVSDHLKKSEIPFAYLDGSVRDRQAEIEKFQNDKNISIFLISLKAGGLGLNLTKADYVFLLDPWWNPAAEAQAIDRAHRIGQKNKVFTYKFIARDTLEEKILSLQESKMKLAQDLITIEESFVKSLSKNDIKNLFA
ncbi:MAG: SNF2 family DNA or RNA helicase [Cyclobacteriaceae bacterium]|jgi:SNF2 family DNA or RNA helicase